MAPNEPPDRSSPARPQTMKAARIHQWGTPDVITVESVSVPEPTDEEVLIRVHAAGVGPWDALVRTGSIGVPQTLPLTLGSEVSGIVEKIGGKSQRPRLARLDHLNPGIRPASKVRPPRRCA